MAGGGAKIFKKDIAERIDVFDLQCLKIDAVLLTIVVKSAEHVSELRCISIGCLAVIFLINKKLFINDRQGG